MAALVESNSLGLRRRKVIKPRRASFVKTETRQERVRRTLRKTFVWGGWISAFLVVAAIITSAFFYSHYSEIVERRVNAGFWQTRAGMYAAPFQIRKDQSTTPDNLVDLLRRAGYIEGNADGNVWTGSFTRTGGDVEITTSNAYNLEPETTTIRFDKNRIAEIRHNGVLTDDYQVEAEMLSGRSETKRGKNHVLKFEEIPDNLRNAIIAAEDQRFFDHYGIDPRGIARAAWANISGREIRQGGSTITQQLVKNTFLTPERSFTRKFSEAFLSVALENKMSKQDIFAVYCNEIYLGQYGASGVHGVEQAARAYFDKGLKDVSLAEAATIAAMIKNPRSFAPHRNPENAAERRNLILARMSELGFAHASDAELARASEIKLAQPKRNDRAIAPYFVDAAMRELSDEFKGDYLNSNLNTRVYTTIDTQMQTIAERAVAKHLEGLDKSFAKKGKRLQATIVALDPHTGHILAMVGGRDYRESQFNRATDALRAPGSTFKPIVYATAYERGYTPISVAADRPTEFATIGGKPYKPSNYRDSYAMTNVTLKNALVKSSNVVAVRTAMDVGIGSVAAKAREFGFQNIDAWPSLALGTIETTPLQLAAAYAPFANGGKRIEPTFIDKIVSGEEDMIYISAKEGKQVIREQTAYLITDALTDVVKRGTAAKANGALGSGVVFAGKTGTTNDGWFVGYTPNLVTVAWVGLDENEDLYAKGGDIALPLWVDFMRDVVKLRPEYGGSQFQVPKGVTEVIIDPETGMAAGPHCPMKETAVVPTSAATYFRCLRHQPMETMFAMGDTQEFDQYAVEGAPTEIPAYTSDGYSDQGTPGYSTPASGSGRVPDPSKERVIYDEYSNDDELNIRRPSTPASESDDPPAPPSRKSTRPTREMDLSRLEGNGIRP